MSSDHSQLYALFSRPRARHGPIFMHTNDWTVIHLHSTLLAQYNTTYREVARSRVFMSDSMKWAHNPDFVSCLGAARRVLEVLLKFRDKFFINNGMGVQCTIRIDSVTQILLGTFRNFVGDKVQTNFRICNGKSTDRAQSRAWQSTKWDRKPKQKSRKRQRYHAVWYNSK